MTSCLRGVLVQVSCPGSLVPGPPRHPRIRNMRPWASGLGCSATFTEATSKDGRDSGLVWPKAMEEVKRARLALNTVRVIGWLLLYHYRSRLEVQPDVVAGGGVIRGHLEEHGILPAAHDVGELVGGLAEPRVGVHTLDQHLQIGGEPVLVHHLQFAVVADRSEE